MLLTLLGYSLVWVERVLWKEGLASKSILPIPLEIDLDFDGFNDNMFNEIYNKTTRILDI